MAINNKSIDDGVVSTYGSAQLSSQLAMLVDKDLADADLDTMKTELAKIAKGYRSKASFLAEIE